MKKILLMLAAAMTVASGMSAQTSYVNETSKVGTSKEAWHGTGMYGDKSVTPLGGTSVGLPEFYCEGDATSQLVPGFTPLYQTVSGLTAGTYKVEFYVTAHEAWDKVSLGDKGATANVAYVKVGSEEKTAPFTSYQNNGMADNEPIKVTFDNLTITEGSNLEMGIKVVEEKATNWYTIQIASLQRVATEAEALPMEIATLNGYKETLNALVAKYPYASAATLEALQTLVTKTESVDTTSLAAVSALNTEIAAYLDNASNERKLAEEDAVFAGLETENNKAVRITINNPDAAVEMVKSDGENHIDTNGGWSWFTNGNTNFQAAKSGQSPTLADGTEIPNYFDGWGGSGWRIGVQQNVNLEPGDYRLSVLSRAQEGLMYFRMLVVPDKDATERLDCFIENESDAVTSNEVLGNVVKLTDNGGSGGVFGRGWEMSVLDFTIPEPAAPEGAMAEAAATKKVCITVQAGTDNNHSGKWQGFTHFQLVKKPKDIGSGISGAVVEDVNAPVEYFDLNGIRVNADNLKKGIYIKRQGNKVTKIIK